jgi:hypothetical protein
MFNPNMFSTLFFYANSVELTAKRIMNYLVHSHCNIQMLKSWLKPPQHLLARFFLKK